TYLKDNDYAVITAKSCDIFNCIDEPANREIVQVKASPILLDKAGFRHYMEKEIHEQPDAISHTISAMSDSDGSLTAGLDVPSLSKIKRIVLLAAGTSFYAAQIGRYWIEKLSGIPVVCEIASEYHYRDPAATGQTTAIAVSQSGESIDTLMAMRHAKTLGLDTFGIVNVADSTIAREADKILLTRAGPEIGVASTKAFTAQLIVLICLAIVLGRQNGHLDASRVTYLYQKLLKIPGAVGKSMKLFDPIRPIAHQLKNARSCLFLGRDMLFPLACEGALKLKELSYIHAEGFASGEMKHGPIALLEDGLPIVSFVSEDEMALKVISNLKEAEARGGYIIVIGTQAAVDLIDFAAAKIVIPDCEPIFAPIVGAIPAQILAYLTALEKGTDIDQPRNLAKSVTVE
ncbi:MAG: glutamine--fructose-6-phosphate transaminase (isomerizing), partial [Alphaproteobacteria bacterium]